MTTLAAVLGDDSLDGLYQWPGTSVPASLLSSARNQGWTVGVAQLGAAHTKADTLKALQRDLEFPEWFGQNWDALADSLFEWSTSARCLLVLEDIRADHDTVETLLIAAELGLRVEEVPVVMHVRQGGRPSNGAVASAYHLGRMVTVLLASLLGLSGRRAP